MAKTHETFGDNVILKMETGEIKSAGGIVLATETSREAMAREEGVIESHGEHAFSDLQNKPKIGDTVIIARYSGKTLGKYDDGFERRVISDVTILARVINN